MPKIFPPTDTVSTFKNPEQDTRYLKFLKVTTEKYFEISQRKMWKLTKGENEPNDNIVLIMEARGNGLTS